MLSFGEMNLNILIKWNSMKLFRSCVPYPSSLPCNIYHSHFVIVIVLFEACFRHLSDTKTKVAIIDNTSDINEFHLPWRRFILSVTLFQWQKSQEVFSIKPLKIL